jgi:hypothetical protein
MHNLNKKANKQGQKGGNCGVTCSPGFLRRAGVPMSGFPENQFEGMTNSNPRPYRPIDW